MNPFPSGTRVHATWRLLRLDRPIGIWLLLWPTLWGLWIAAEGLPPLATLGIFVAGVVLMRSAGCAINDYADRDFDGRVQRTADRPLANGDLAPGTALVWFAILTLTAFWLVLHTNTLTILYSFVAAALAASYPFAKRLHSFPQVHLGIAFAWAIPMAWTAIHASHPPLVMWLLFSLTIAWIVVYDTFYAMVDREDDLAIGVRSTAIAFGEHDRLVTATLQIVVLAGLVLLGRQLEFGWPYYIGLGFAALLMLQQQVLIQNRDRDGCFRAFRANHWFGMAIFAGIATEYLLRDDTALASIPFAFP